MVMAVGLEVVASTAAVGAAVASLVVAWVEPAVAVVAVASHRVAFHRVVVVHAAAFVGAEPAWAVASMEPVAAADSC